MHPPITAENSDRSDNISDSHSDSTGKFDQDKQTEMKQRVDMSSSHESSCSTELVAIDSEDVGGQRDRAEQNLVRGNAEGGRPGRARRTPARYRDFCMEGRVGGRQGTDNTFQTRPKSVGSVRFPYALTRVTPRLTVINNNGVSRRSLCPSIVSNLGIDEFVRMNF